MEARLVVFHKQIGTLLYSLSAYGLFSLKYQEK